jgi:endo-chitodextinase
VDAGTKDAARFLTQATFGLHGPADLDALKAKGYPAWLDEQFAMNANSHVQYVNDRKAAGESAAEERAYEAIWQQWLWEPAQLRARMSFALSEIFVVSNVAPDLDTYAMASYMDMLNRDAFGTYRQLLEDVTLHPAMGYYLNLMGSKKADPARGTHPNENYAREVMQLFSIGLVKLNADGTPQLDAAGRPVPTYDQAAVQGMAAALSGWNFAGNDTSNAAIFNPAKADWLDPMLPWEMWHDPDAKTLFDAIHLPAGQGARKDLKDVLDALANHPNVGPFIGRRLIQRFVTSNPSPAYIGRVAAAFADNGQGVRGDLRATLRAVLLDPEARDPARAADPKWGKQREPVIRFANFLRALNATSPSGRNRIWYLDSADEGLNQSPLLSPSVFNFFSPDYRQPGALSAAGLVAPEFQITTETSMVGGLNFFAALVKNGAYGSGDTKLTLDLTALNALANTPGALADRLNLLFLDGMMSDAFRANLVSTVGALPPVKTGSTALTDRVKAALVLVALSPEFAIQK